MCHHLLLSSVGSPVDLVVQRLALREGLEQAVPSWPHRDTHPGPVSPIRCVGRCDLGLNGRWKQRRESPVTGEVDPIRALGPLVGEWRLTAIFEGLPPADPEKDAGARVRFEWLPGERFLIERWEIPIPDAPDGIAIIGADPEHEGEYLQHYFDSRGVARVYRMTFADGVWRLWRDEPDLSPLDFSQRFTGSLSADGTTITGAWEICHDGTTWEHDFDLTYTRIDRKAEGDGADA
jgi:hypothetical protein